MKTIIAGRVYDTDTAERVCELECRVYRSDFAWHETSLYRSPKGQFFVAGRGNARSMWAEPAYGGGSGPGSGLRLVDEDEARRIMERAGCTEADFARVGLSVDEG